MYIDEREREMCVWVWVCIHTHSCILPHVYLTYRQSIS